MADYRAFFAQNGVLLQQAALYRPDPNPTFANPAFEAADFRILIVRLSPFQDVDRSTPHLFLFQAVRRALPGAYIDMAFFPPQHDRARLDAHGVPFLVGTQSFHGVEDFDAVLISNAYTLELINLPYLLLRSGAPVLASQRDATWPPLILGGSNAMATQAIVTEKGDSVVDALFFGEGEGEVGTLVRALRDHARIPKRDRLLCAAAAVSGLWVANGPPERSVTKAVCAAPGADDLLVAYPLLNSAEAGTARLQINFGCPAFCSFCFEGYDRKPYREVASEAIVAAARRLKLAQGPETLDLYSFNFNTHQDILALLPALNRLFYRVGFKSQRVDVLAALPGLPEAEVIADKRSFTLGVEGISRRMRALLHKSLSGADVDAVLARLLRKKIREIKLFYILTGHESEDDLAEFRDFVRGLKELRERTHRGVRIIFSFGLLIRMPFTPLRHDRLFLDEAEWRGIVGPAKSACEIHGFEFRLATPWDAYAASQVLALGGYWLHEPVLALAEQGYCYDTNLTPGYWDALQQWLRDHGHWDARFLGEKAPTHPFPLEFVRTAIAPGFLYRQYRQALSGVDEGYCLGDRCLACGACQDPAQREAITGHVMRHPGGNYLHDLEALMRTKWRLRPVYARLWLPPEIAGVEPEWLNAWVMRCLLQARPVLVDNLLAVEESLFTTKENRRNFAGFHGETVFAFKAWEAAALVAALVDVTTTAGGVKVLEVLEAFEPGAFERMTIALTLPTARFLDAGQQLRRFLRDAYVPVNVRREGDGYCFDIPAKALKKKVLFEGEYRQGELSFEARLVVGPRFDLLGYLRSFPEPGRYREARVEVVDLEL